MESAAAPTLPAIASHGIEPSSGDSISSASTRADPPVAGVDVKRAEGEFEDLRRQLTRTSSLHRTITGQKDAEKADEDDFDLLEYMTDSAAKRGAHGFRKKEVGVIWDNLTVTGAGGMKVRPGRGLGDRGEEALMGTSTTPPLDPQIFIRTFPDAIKEFLLSPVFMVLKHTSMFTPKPKNLLFGASVDPDLGRTNKRALAIC